MASDRIGDTATRVLLAVVSWPGPRPPYVDDLAASLDLPKMTTYGALCSLRKRGLVTWETNRRGTIRALVEVVS